jgi:hypothetical protein
MKIQKIYYFNILHVLGMRTEDCGDSEPKLTLDRMDPTNLRPEVRVATHLRLACRIKSATRSSSGGGSALWRTQGDGDLASEITFLYRRRTMVKEARTEVRWTDDVARWIRVMSQFMGHGNICKPQMTVMTPCLYGH